MKPNPGRAERADTPSRCGTWVASSGCPAPTTWCCSSGWIGKRWVSSAWWATRRHLLPRLRRPSPRPRRAHPTPRQPPARRIHAGLPRPRQNRSSGCYAPARFAWRLHSPDLHPVVQAKCAGDLRGETGIVEQQCQVGAQRFTPGQLCQP